MRHWNQCIFFSLSLFFIESTVVCSCKSNHSKTITTTDITKLDFIIPSKSDSSIIANSTRNIVKVDTLTSQFGCSVTFKFFDSSNHLRALKSRQLCISDTRLKWSNEIYYNENEKEMLEISRDGLNKIVELKQLY